MILKKINELANYNNNKSLANSFRNKRFQFFENQFKAFDQMGKVRILDIGGTESFWVNRGYHNNKNVEITILNLFKTETKYSNFIGYMGDACNLSEFNKNHFDLVFSNSVIEHLFTYENQEKMAKEVLRVGKNYFIQTPNKYFFVEPHYLLPFFQFLPKGFRKFILTKTPLSRGKKRTPDSAQNSLDEIQLLSLKQMKHLFPGGKVYKEKFLGMNKSFTSYIMDPKR